MNIGTQKEALANPAAYSFRKGLGYVQHDRTPQPNGKYPIDKCTPPANTVDGTFHLLIVPGSENTLAFAWHKATNSWARTGGRRLGFTAAYLSSHGWTYYGPV